jgi:flagellar biosynthetic protein FlhB
MSDDKTEEPSDKKISDARKDGNVSKSKDLTGVVAFAVGMGVVKGTWSNFETTITSLFLFSIDHLAHPKDLGVATQQLILLALTSMLTISIPIVFATAFAGGLLDFLQVGALFTTKVLVPKLDKLNPLAGLKNMVGKKQVVELAKSIFKLSVTGYVVYGVVRDAMGMVVATINGDANLTFAVMGELVFRVVQKVTLLFIGFAIFDVWWQRHSYNKGLMMSKEDVKKEYKESEGDPHTKAKRKEIAMELLESAGMAEVPNADVVVTNPEHMAVALKYDKEKDVAPRLIAKGINARAEVIREAAKKADVPMMRNVPLAHALYRVDINQQIPEELYDAVAEVLNFVYQLQQEQKPGAPAVRSRA